jgi:hypothetical protein
MARTSDTNTKQRPNDPPLLILTSLAGGPKHGHATDDRRRPYQISAAGSVYLSEAVAEMQRLANEGARRLAVASRTSASRRIPNIAGSPA